MPQAYRAKVESEVKTATIPQLEKLLETLDYEAPKLIFVAELLGVPHDAPEMQVIPEIRAVIAAELRRRQALTPKLVLVLVTDGEVLSFNECVECPFFEVCLFGELCDTQLKARSS